MKKADYGEKESSRAKEKRHKSGEKREKSHSHKTKEKKSEETESKNEDISDMDFDDQTLEALPKHLKPIWVFMDDRKEMLEQIFSTIQESSLQKLLPKELKNFNLEQIKSVCSEQLMAMSENYLLYILTGGNPDTFVEKSTEKEESPITENSKGCSKRKRDEEPDVRRIPEKRPNTEDIETIVLEPGVSDEQSSEALELYATPSEVQSLNEEDSVLSVLSDVDNTDLELLELEMRAKAIRALLKYKALQSSDDEEGKG